MYDKESYFIMHMKFLAALTLVFNMYSKMYFLATNVSLSY